VSAVNATTRITTASASKKIPAATTDFRTSGFTDFDVTPRRFAAQRCFALDSPGDALETQRVTYDVK
jgi:hypothetical protein